MYVRKVRGQDKVGKIILTAAQVAVVRKLGIPLEEYVKQTLLLIAKKRRWKWYLNKEKKT
jgi:hypothetical protein